MNILTHQKIINKLLDDQRYVEKSIENIYAHKLYPEKEATWWNYFAGWIISGKHFTGKYARDAQGVSLRYVDKLLHLEQVNSGVFDRDELRNQAPPKEIL